MAKFTVKPGSKLTIGIGDDADRSQPRQSPSRFIGAETSDEGYVFRKKGVFQFYDLGTRLVTRPSSYIHTGLELREPGATDEPSVGDGLINEYVEIRHEVEGVNSLIGLEPVFFGSTPISVSNEQFAQLESALLGSLVEGAADPLNPLKFTKINSDGQRSRLASHCMPLYYGIVGQNAFSSVPFPVKVNNVLLSTLMADGRAKVRSGIPLGVNRMMGIFPASESDAAERWYEDNQFSGAAWDWLQFSKDYISSLKGGPIAVADAFGFYYPFDTNDTTKTKVTTELSFAADDAEYKFSGQDGFYLRPRLGALARVAVVSGVVRCVASWVSRTYSFALKNQIVPVTQNVFGFPARNWVRRSNFSHFADNPTAEVGNTPNFNVQSEPTLVNELPHGSLIGIISSPTRTYYLWRRWR